MAALKNDSGLVSSEISRVPRENQFFQNLFGSDPASHFSEQFRTASILFKPVAIPPV
jgi:hypothetical protein